MSQPKLDLSNLPQGLCLQFPVLTKKVLTRFKLANAKQVLLTYPGQAGASIGARKLLEGIRHRDPKIFLACV